MRNVGSRNSNKFSSTTTRMDLVVHGWNEVQAEQTRDPVFPHPSPNTRTKRTLERIKAHCYCHCRQFFASYYNVN